MTNACRGPCTSSSAAILAQQFRPRVGRIKNGDLLLLAENEFDLFITSDQNIRYQQNLTGRRIAILELSTNDIRRIQAGSGLIEEALETLTPNEFKQLHIP